AAPSTTAAATTISRTTSADAISITTFDSGTFSSSQNSPTIVAWPIASQTVTPARRRAMSEAARSRRRSGRGHLQRLCVARGGRVGHVNRRDRRGQRADRAGRVDLEQVGDLVAPAIDPPLKEDAAIVAGLAAAPPPAGSAAPLLVQLAALDRLCARR